MGIDYHGVLLFPDHNAGAEWERDELRLRGVGRDGVVRRDQLVRLGEEQLQGSRD